MIPIILSFYFSPIFHEKFITIMKARLLDEIFLEILSIDIRTKNLRRLLQAQNNIFSRKNS